MQVSSYERRVLNRALESGWPRARSGHRTFVDNDFLYVIGGFNDQPADTIMKEVHQRVDPFAIKYSL